MAVFCGMPTIQYSARSARLSVHKPFTSCIRRGLVSRNSIVDGDWLPATKWCQCFLPCCPDVSNQIKSKNLGVHSVYGLYWPGKWLWIDCNGKMETRNCVDAYFGSEFPAVVIIAELWRPEVFINFCVFLEKRLRTVKFSKFSSNSFYRNTNRRVMFKFCEIWPTRNRLTKTNFAWLSSCLP